MLMSAHAVASAVSLHSASFRATHALYVATFASFHTREYVSFPAAMAAGELNVAMFAVVYATFRLGTFGPMVRPVAIVAVLRLPVTLLLCSARTPMPKSACQALWLVRICSSCVMFKS